MSWEGLKPGDFKSASGKLGLILECNQEPRTVQQLGISKILFWRQEEQSETGDDIGMKAELRRWND